MTSTKEDPQPTVYHSHCNSCFDIKCLARPEEDVSCYMVQCPKGCGSRYHACKADDHTVLCPNVRVACTNAWYGCQKSKSRMDIKNHLQHCPANVVVCGEEVHRQNYHDHFCSEDHDHSCEPCLVKWVDEDSTRPVTGPTDPSLFMPDEDVRKQFEAIYGIRPPQHKSKREQVEAAGDENQEVNKNNEKDADETDAKNSTDGTTSGTSQESTAPEADDENKTETNNNKESDSRYDYLHRVPWQYRQSLTSEANETDSPQATEHLDPPIFVTDETGAFEEEEDQDSLNPSLEGLPLIVLQQIFRYLDASQLALLAVTSKHLRNVTSSLLQEKGMVEMCWQKKDGSWQITKKIWHFGSMKIED